jgi:hypothetical protein
MEWLLGLPEGSCVKRCPGSGPLTVTLIEAISEAKVVMPADFKKTPAKGDGSVWEYEQ